MQVDFAGNFTTQTQNTIQSSYWVSKQFTLFIASVWESHGCHSYVIVSDYLQLDKYAIMTFIMQLIDQIESNIRCFRNCFFLMLLLLSSNRVLPFVKSLKDLKIQKKKQELYGIHLRGFSRHQ